VKAVYAMVGQGSDPAKVYWRVNLVPKDERPDGIAVYKQKLRAILETIPQADASVADPPALEGLGDWPPLYMQIVGPDLDELRRLAQWLAGVMRDVPGTADVQVQDRPGKPELDVRIDRDASARLGLPGGLVALQVRALTFGEEVGFLRDGRVERPIRVRLAGAEREDVSDLGRLGLASPLGPVTLDQVATLAPTVGPSVIEHEARERQIAVTAQTASGASLGKVVAALHARLDKEPLPEGYNLIWNGQQKDMKDMSTSIGLALALAVVFIYMVLASQFESFVHPFTIMLSLPLALIGAVLGLAVTGNTLGMGANIGVILLMGLVTKNAILLVDGALQRISEGADARTAIAEAGPRRLRPILMTSAAMVLGMLPTALGRGMGSEFRSPMAISVIGGVITSTLLTLWVVPVVFLGIERLRGRRPIQR
jgi:multidrug efflux pump subunit AcrB